LVVEYSALSNYAPQSKRESSYRFRRRRKCAEQKLIPPISYHAPPLLPVMLSGKIFFIKERDAFQM